MIIRKKEFNDWLLTAMPFSVWRWSNKEHIIVARDYIFKEIGEEYRTSRDKHKDRDVLLVFLLNLWVGFCCGCPIHISRDTSKYKIGEGRYSKVFFTYKRTIRIFDKLESKGYLQYKNGFHFKDEESGKEARMWATEKLIRLFLANNFQPVGDIINSPVELVQLRNKISKTKVIRKDNEIVEKQVKKSVRVPFEDTEETLAMKKNLEDYNRLASENRIVLKLGNDVEINPATLVSEILPKLITGSIELIDSELDYKNPVENQFYSDVEDSSSKSITSVLTDIPGLMITSVSYKCYEYPIITYRSSDEENLLEQMNNDVILSSITHTLHSQQWQGFQKEMALFLYLFYLKKMFSLIKFKKDRKKEFMYKPHKLIDFGIQSLEIEIKDTALHRVFNKGSFDFDKGGRFYGAYYQDLSSKLRESIFINGNPTAEIDFSGHHIRMLYHQSGLEYENDPYNFAWEEERKDYLHLSGAELEMKKKEARNKYKAVGLISINAEEKSASSAIRKKLEQEKIHYGSGKGCIKELMSKMKNNHEPIKDFLFSGVGLDLQNSDSRIMEQILMALYEKGIVALCIHDSIIVEAQYSELAKAIMIDEYKAFFDGFEPVLKVKSAA